MQEQIGDFSLHAQWTSALCAEVAGHPLTFSVHAGENRTLPFWALVQVGLSVGCRFVGTVRGRVNSPIQSTVVFGFHEGPSHATGPPKEAARVLYLAVPITLPNGPARYSRP